MRHAIIWLLGVGALFVATTAWAEDPKPASGEVGPYYFLAIHNEPFHVPGGETRLAESYEVLRKMIDKADGYGIRLTLMFSPPWADFILADDERMRELARWKEAGHEIAAHHHSIYHGNWDGYTAAGREEAEAARRGRTRNPEPYLGTLDEFLSRVRQLDPKVDCGCLNDEGDKDALPDGIVFDTCSGFANFGPPGRRLHDGLPEKGVNEYVSVGTVGNISRKWLCHFQTTRVERVDGAKEAFSKMGTGVYGSVNHSSQREWSAFVAWLDFLHSRDPDGRRCRTVSEVIEQRLLPEKEIPSDVLHASPTPAPPREFRAEIARTVPVLTRLLQERRAAGADVAEAERLDRASRQALRQGQAEQCLRLLRRAVKTLKDPDADAGGAPEQPGTNRD